MKFQIMILLFVIVSTRTFSVHVTVRLSNQTGEFSQVGQDLPNTPYPNNHPDFLAAAWTNGGVPVIGRHFFKFNLSQIPQGAIIQSAKLNLYANPYPTQAPHSTLSGSNASYIRRVVQPWSSQTCTFNNQPAYTFDDEVLLPASVSVNQDYLNIDVMGLVLPMIAQNQNYGFVLMLQTEQHYRSMNFGSGACIDTLKRPVLEIEYDFCTPYVYNDSPGQEDAVLSDASPQTNYIGSGDFVAYAANLGGQQFKGRSLLNFDVSIIPSGATIQMAYLDLYSNPNPFFPSTTISGGNDCLLMRITQNWTPAAVNFQNQPATTLQNAVLLQAPTSSVQDYIGIDVKNLLVDIVNNPGTGYGLILQLISESGNKSLNFCSANYPDTTKHPTLRICFQSSQGVEYQEINPVSIYPNPVVDNIHLQTNDRWKVTRIIDVSGRVLFRSDIYFSGSNTIDVSDFNKGVYFLILSNESGIHKNIRFIRQ